MRKSHRALEQLLRGFNTAYNDRRQRVLDGKTPNQVTAERFKAEPKLARDAPNGHAELRDVTKARLMLIAPRRSHNQTHRLSLEIAALRAEGVSTHQGLARALSERGVETPRGGRRWTHTTVARLLERALA